MCPWLEVMDQSLEVMTQQMVKSHLGLVLAGWLLLADTGSHSVGLGRMNFALPALLALLALQVLLAFLVLVALLALLIPLAVLEVLVLLILLVVLALALEVLGSFPQGVDSFPLGVAHSGLKVGLSQQLAHSVRSQDWWIRQAGRSSPSAPPCWNSQSPNKNLNRMGNLVGILQEWKTRSCVKVE
jgi:hypothetical protein